MDHFQSNIWISLSGILLQFQSEISLSVSDAVAPFCVSPGQPDVLIRVRILTRFPDLPAKPIGADLILNYFSQNARQFAVARPGTLGPATITEFTRDFSEVIVWINEAEHPQMIRTLDKILQLIPIRRLLACHNAFLLHSSRISLGEGSLLFTASSGTGKSTQAKLWNQFESSNILCNDRTLLRKISGDFITNGFPVDGSEPVYSCVQRPLSAIVVLEQGKDNRISTMTAFEAIKSLMEQTVLDTWDLEEIDMVRCLWMDLVEKYPVYRLICRPDRDAVYCLKQRLQMDGVIE